MEKAISGDVVCVALHVDREAWREWEGGLRSVRISTLQCQIPCGGGGSG